MKVAFKVLCTTLLAWLLAAGYAQASTLKDITFEDQPKKIIVRLLFDEQVTAEVVSHFTNNFVALSIDGLTLSRSQKDKKYTPPGDNAQFLKHVLLQASDNGAQIRFYMGQLATPADAQVVPLDAKIIVEIIKPLWKLGSTDEDSGDGGGETAPPDVPPADGGFVPDDQGAPDAGTTPETPPADDSGIIAPEDTGAPTPADGGFTPGPAYTQFDLDQVAVNQLDIRGMPFDEALVELVEGTGFNVVVGPGIDDAEVNLSFTQKNISLKSALDLLCFAYDLAYTVKDDAIVFSTK